MPEDFRKQARSIQELGRQIQNPTLQDLEEMLRNVHESIRLSQSVPDPIQRKELLTSPAFEKTGF